MPASCGSPPAKDTNPPSQGSGLSLWVPASRSPSRVRLPSQRACFPPEFLNLAKDIQHRRVNKAERRILEISKSGPKRNLGVGCREPNRQKMGNFKFGRKTLRRHSLRRFLLALDVKRSFGRYEAGKYPRVTALPVLVGPADGRVREMFCASPTFNCGLFASFNLTNTVNFDGRANSRGNRGISSDLNAPATFGRLRSTAGNPRVMQFALRYQF